MNGITLAQTRSLLEGQIINNFSSTSQYFERLYNNAKHIGSYFSTNNSSGVIYLITGSIGAGKSTVAYNVVNYFDLNQMPFISNDIVYRCCFAKGRNFEQEYDSARKKTDELLYKLTRNNQSFVWETVLSKSKKVEFLENCKRMGYNIVCFFVYSDLHTTISRSNKRVAEGNHFVSKEFICDRYEKSLRAFKWLKIIADSLIALENNDRLVLKYYKSDTEIYVDESTPTWMTDEFV